jgi:hypothetical protein
LICSNPQTTTKPKKDILRVAHQNRFDQRSRNSLVGCLTFVELEASRICELVSISIFAARRERKCPSTPRQAAAAELRYASIISARRL